MEVSRRQLSLSDGSLQDKSKLKIEMCSALEIAATPVDCFVGLPQGVCAE